MMRAAFHALPAPVRAGIRALRRRVVPAPARPVSRIPGAIDLSDPAWLADPHGAYAALRRGGPVQHVAAQGFWIVLGHAEMRAASAAPDIFSNAPYADVDAVLIGRDPPEHDAVRRLIARRFDPAAVQRIVRLAATLAPSLLQPRLDAVADYAVPFSRRIAAALIGLDAAELATLLADSDAATRDPAPLPALIRVLDDIADRAEAHGWIGQADPRLPDAQVRSLVRFLWLAAITTTERVIVRSALCLVERPDLLARLRADGKLLAPFVEEMLRLHPPEQMIPRRTTRATRLGGVDIPAGAEVQLCIAAANRDPAIFDDPEAFRFDREARHLTFGSGIHHCSGTALARRVIPIALGALVDAPGLRALQPLETIDWFETVQARVPRSLAIGT